MKHKKHDANPTAPTTTAALILSLWMPAWAQPVAEAPDADEPIVELIDLTDQQGDNSRNAEILEVGAFGEIDLSVQDLEVSSVLNLLSEQSRRNIVASPNVRGTISANLFGVTFDEALEGVLVGNGFRYTERGNFIYVYTAEEMAEIQSAAAAPVTRIIRLNFLSATDAQAFAEPLLSESGVIAISSEVPEGFEASISDGGANTFSHSDTLIVRDLPDRADEIVALLQELDRKPEQVMIEVTILQARLGENNAFGVDFAILTDLSLADAATPLGAVNELISGTLTGDSGTAIASTAGNTRLGESSLKLGVIGGDAAVFVRALETITDTTVVATPKVVVLNRQRATIDATEQLPFISTTETEVSSTQTIETIDVGTQLYVRPFVSSDGYVRLELNPVLSEGNTEVSPLGVILPNTSRQELQTNVMVRSGQTVVLGGLFTEDTTSSTNQVPFLGRIPILGNAFRGTDDSSDRLEIIFLIKPTIVRDQALAKAGEAAREGIERIRLGARSGLLPNSRIRMLRSHLADAQRFARAGNTSKALWHTNIALSLEPTSAEALSLKSQLVGSELHATERGLLQGPIERVLQQAIKDFNESNPAPAPPPAVTEPLVAPKPETEADTIADLPIPTPTPTPGNQAAANQSINLSADDILEQASSLATEILSDQPHVPAPPTEATNADWVNVMINQLLEVRGTAQSGLWTLQQPDAQNQQAQADTEETP
ncbi:type II secretion system protein GspD [Mucisphaera sp.]|uniref:type II secretion system protein GspD n=1 Tax=Mucisphaera sp. TaxID=2913024 RepID=UPI003D0FD184